MSWSIPTNLGKYFLFCYSGYSLLIVNVIILQLVSGYCHSLIGPMNSTVILGVLAGEWLHLLIYVCPPSLSQQEDVSGCGL